jgi:hypothetical protein
MAYTDTRNSVISNQVFSAATKLLAFSVSSPGAYGALAANLGFDLVEFGDPLQCGTLTAALGRARLDRAHRRMLGNCRADPPQRRASAVANCARGRGC